MLDHAFRSSMFRDATVYRGRMASMRELAVMAGAVLLLAAVPAHAQDAHGVIAFGEAAGGSVCTVVGSACASPGGEPGAWSGSESVLAPREEKPAASPLATSGEDELTREQAEALATAGREVRKPAASAEAAEGPRRLQTRVLHFPEAGPKCKGMPEGSSCWLEIADKTGCFAFTNYYIPNYTVSWSGSCEGDTAVGRGVLRRSDLKNPDYSREDSGELLQGKQHGHWVEGWKAGFVLEGPYVDGKQHGRWVIRGPDGSVYSERQWRDGKVD